MIWKLLMVAETTFHKLHAPELVTKVVAGAKYSDGVEIAAKEAPQQYKMAA